MSSPVSVRKEGDIAVIQIDNPPVNALSQAVRQGIDEAIAQVNADGDIKAAVIACAGRTFIAGADIREFGKPPQAPALPDVVARIESAEKPIVAALHGTALGGGFEVALGAHYRVALKGSKVGLPEVHLGILPGAGGTQRLPRLIGVEVALDMMLTGKHVAAEKAEALGAVDAVVDGSDPVAAGIEFAKQLLADGKGVRPTCDVTDKIEGVTKDSEVFKTAEAGLAKTARGLFSPFRIVEAAQAAVELPFVEGMAKERELFLQCMDSPQREGLIHAFFSEREVSKIPEAASAQPREIKKVGVIGGGTMGAGIAISLLDAGYPVIMVERDDESIERGRVNVTKVYDRNVKKGRMTAEARDKLLAEQFSTSTSYDVFADVDLVIEAVYEDMGVKKEVFTTLDKIMKQGAILATNTSYLDIDEIAAVTSRPEDVIGLHFFSPANIMKLLEIVVAEKTAADVTATSFALAKRLRKVAVRAGVCDGFIGNRVLAYYRKVADYLMEDGASPYDIDKALVAYGYPMGPYQVGDLAGLDIGWATRKRKAPTRDPRERVVDISDRICEKGWFGQKTGRGFYIYDESAPRGRPDPEIEAIIDAERERKGITPKSFSAEEIVRRYMVAMINEGANVVHEGIALRPLDVDMTLLFGYGFPRWRGGPMKYADMIGLDKVLADIREFAKEDEFFWQPSPLLVELVEKGKTFDDLNKAG